ncbi:hypothetical protein GCM10018793_21320 [Streptomyces sulfonofaciens]|uniref:Uncharacterized protein n=1 Tax=Streptomyces sulfonofaciens TaxID=68272 RepID=A0A919KXD0_9ACTN|nr:hypothetical protein GCM10018793_21320 [Streptomyces sulfonofaciens]
MTSCHHALMPPTVPTPPEPDHPCGKPPVDNSVRCATPAVDGCGADLTLGRTRGLPRTGLVPPRAHTGAHPGAPAAYPG